MKLFDVPMPAEFRKSMEAEGCSNVRAYATSSGLRVLCSIDPTQHGRLLHISISREDRYPSWDEIKAVREALLPMDTDFMMMFPKRGHYINEHKNCFHIWQTPEGWDVL